MIISCSSSRVTRNVEVMPLSIKLNFWKNFHDAMRMIHDTINIRIFMTCVYTSSIYSPWLKSSRAQRHAAWRPSNTRKFQEPSSQSGSPASCCPHAWYWQHNCSSHPRSSQTTASPSACSSTRNTPSLPRTRKTPERQSRAELRCPYDKVACRFRGRCLRKLWFQLGHTCCRKRLRRSACGRILNCVNRGTR
jgi:hypothetical protein